MVWWERRNKTVCEWDQCWLCCWYNRGSEFVRDRRLLCDQVGAGEVPCEGVTIFVGLVECLSVN